MIYLSYFILTFSLVQLLVALVNLIFAQKLKLKDSVNGLVSVLIPVRNEEKNIGNLLNDLLNQDYHDIEIIVFNDSSKDKTCEIVTEFVKRDSKIQLINSDRLPNGWLGKNYACHRLSVQARGKYFLFLDADVRLNKDIIIKAVSYAQKHKLGLLSVFPQQQMESLGEYLTVPNMNFILLSLLPMILVRKSKFESLSAANGQFMMFNASIYLENAPHHRFKGSKVEDIEIARYYKKSAIPVACVVGNETIQCRMYTGFKEAVNGFSKNVIAFFGNSFIMGIVFWLLSTFGFIAVLYSFDFSAFCFYLLIILSTRAVISIISKQNILANLVLFVPQLFTLGVFIYKAFIKKIKNQYEWKGRNIS